MVQSARSVSDDNPIAVLKEIVTYWKIPVTNSGITQIKLNPHYPSLASLSDILQEWEVENMAVRIPLSKLAEIPLPAIAHLQKGEGCFVVVKEVGENAVKYYQPEEGDVHEPFSDFIKYWDGVVLLASPNAQSGERNFAANARREQNLLARKYAMIMMAIVCGLFPLLNTVYNGTFIVWLILFLSHGIGLYVSLQLFQSLLGKQTSLVNKVCQQREKNKCTEVITSSRWNVFCIHQTEIVMIYFVAASLATIVAGLSSWQILNAVLCSSAFASLFTIYTLAHQLILSKWCRLCLIITFVIWVQAFAAFTLGDSTSLFFGNGYLLLPFCLAAVFSFWLSIRDLVLKGSRVLGLEKRIITFSRNKDIFKAWVDGANPKLKDIAGVIIGNMDTQQRLTVITNPLCAPCAETHHRLKTIFQTLKT